MLAARYSQSCIQCLLSLLSQERSEQTLSIGKTNVAWWARNLYGNLVKLTNAALHTNSCSSALQMGCMLCRCHLRDSAFYRLRYASAHYAAWKAWRTLSWQMSSSFLSAFFCLAFWMPEARLAMDSSGRMGHVPSESVLSKFCHHLLPHHLPPSLSLLLLALASFFRRCSSAI